MIYISCSIPRMDPTYPERLSSHDSARYDATIALIVAAVARNTWLSWALDTFGGDARCTRGGRGRRHCQSGDGTCGVGGVDDDA